MLIVWLKRKISGLLHMARNTDPRIQLLCYVYQGYNQIYEANQAEGTLATLCGDSADC